MDADRARDAPPDRRVSPDCRTSSGGRVPRDDQAVGGDGGASDSRTHSGIPAFSGIRSFSGIRASAARICAQFPRPYATDAAIAGTVAAMLVGGTLLPGAPSGPGQVGVTGYLLLLGGSAALVARRAAPVAALAVTAACMLGYAVWVHPETAPAFPVLITVFSAASAGRHAWTVLASAAYLGGVLVMELSDPGTRTPREVLDRAGLLVGWFVAANVAGVVSRQRRAYLRQAEQRAIEAERTREEVALRRAGEERLRIARELHDSLTHNISIIKVQAGVAVHLARKRGEEVPPALLAIRDASAAAMRELRATLEVLREPGEDDTPGTARADRIGELVEGARSAGVPATLVVTGTSCPLPPEVDLTAYRIVQEALTNVARHAGPASASVHVRYLPDALVIRVVNDGRVEDDGRGVPGDAVRAQAAGRVTRSGAGRAGAGSAGAGSAGVGLTGMRERVSALGGRLQAGPAPDGGFVVHAELPLAVGPSPAPEPPTSGGLRSGSVRRTGDHALAPGEGAA